MKKTLDLVEKNTRSGTTGQNAYYSSEPLLPCDCYAIKTNIRTIRSQVLQSASAGNGADLVNCKLITAWHQNSEPRLVCSVIVISANKTAIARIKSVKLSISGF